MFSAVSNTTKLVTLGLLATVFAAAARTPVTVTLAPVVSLLRISVLALSWRRLISKFGTAPVMVRLPTRSL